MPAPSGKDADPKEYLWYFEGRGRRLAVIGARDFACNVAARPTSPLAQVLPGVADLGDVAVVGAAAASEHGYVGQARA
jgi:hypothetical protein